MVRVTLPWRLAPKFGMKPCTATAYVTKWFWSPQIILKYIQTVSPPGQGVRKTNK